MKPTSEQLRIALQITEAEESGNPVEWEIKHTYIGSQWCIPAPQRSPICWLNDGYELKIKPWTLGPSINGHALAVGQEWHRLDFTREDLPADYRPHILGELDGEGDERRVGPDVWIACSRRPSRFESGRNTLQTRTTRPLPAIKPSIPIPEGWRELALSERKSQWIEGAKFLSSSKKEWKLCPGNKEIGAYAFKGSRVIIPIPWFAEKQAFARGEMIEFSVKDLKAWMATDTPLWTDAFDYRIAPGVWPPCEKEAVQP